MRVGAPRALKAAAGETVAAALQEAVRTFSQAGFPAAHLEAEVLLAHLLGVERDSLWARPEQPIGSGVRAALQRLCARRLKGEPSAYLVGVREFWSLPFRVDARVLVPRPESEGLVEAVLKLCPGPGGRFADLGTGSGCLALALAHEKPQAIVYGIDCSAGALQVAQANAVHFGLAGRFHAIQAASLAVLTPRAGLDAVLSNPPYIPSAEVGSLPREVRDYEPREALAGGPDGLELTRVLIREAERVLARGGCLVLEIHPPSQRHVLRLFQPRRWTKIQMLRDLAGHPRVITAIREGRGPRIAACGHHSPAGGRGRGFKVPLPAHATCSGPGVLPRWPDTASRDHRAVRHPRQFGWNQSAEDRV